MENNDLNKRLKLKAIMLKLSCILIFLFPAIVFGQDSTLVVKYFNPIFIIDIEKGIAGRLRCDRCFNIESFEINNGKIIIKQEQELVIKSYKLEQIFNELNKL
jgi:hypothetical protein